LEAWCSVDSWFLETDSTYPQPEEYFPAWCFPDCLEWFRELGLSERFQES
jgi:hypothetical protein